MKTISQCEVGFDRDIFLRSLVRELSGTLENVVGLEEASGFISIVGQQIGDWMNTQYRNACGCESLNAEQVKEVLIDLKRRIQGDFYAIETDNNKIVLGNRACPFGEKVEGRPSMCMMTSNVFGTVTAENLGFSKVVIRNSIANKDKECRVVVYIRQSDEADASEGREYYKS
jgi:predicted ArsR family transcriptional regulator